MDRRGYDRMGSLFYPYLCNQSISPPTLYIRFTATCKAHSIQRCKSMTVVVDSFLWVLQLPRKLKSDHHNWRVGFYGNILYSLVHALIVC